MAAGPLWEFVIQKSYTQDLDPLANDFRCLIFAACCTILLKSGRPCHRRTQDDIVERRQAGHQFLEQRSGCWASNEELDFVDEETCRAMRGWDTIEGHNASLGVWRLRGGNFNLSVKASVQTVFPDLRTKSLFSNFLRALYISDPGLQSFSRIPLFVRAGMVIAVSRSESMSMLWAVGSTHLFLRELQ